MRTSILLIPGLAMAASAAFAGQHIDLSGLIKPGLYQTTTKTTMKGMPMPMPSRTAKSCITKQDIDGDFVKTLLAKIKSHKSQVKLKDVSLKGKHLRLTMIAAGWVMHLDNFFMDPTHYYQTTKATMTIDGATHQMVSHGVGHRIGDCTSDNAAQS